MAEIKDGIRSILASPFVYNFFQDLVGARRTRRELVEGYVHALPHENVLDIGCGTGEILRHLPDVNYYGIDISADYIETARRFYGNRGQFIAGEVSEEILGALPKFDKVVASCLLHHIDDENASELFRIVRSALHPKGRFVSIDPCLTGPGQSRAARFVIRLDRGRNVRSPEAYRRLAAESFGQIRTHLRTDLLNIPYEHMIMVCEKDDSLQ